MTSAPFVLASGFARILSLSYPSRRLLLSIELCSNDTLHRLVPGPVPAFGTPFLHLVIGKRPCSRFWNELCFLLMRTPFDSTSLT